MQVTLATSLHEKVMGNSVNPTLRSAVFPHETISVFDSGNTCPGEIDNVHGKCVLLSWDRDIYDRARARAS